MGLRTSDALGGLVENDIFLERVGPDYIIVVRVFRPPNNAGSTILGPGDGLELDLDEAVLKVGVVLQNQRIGRSAGLPQHSQFSTVRSDRFRPSILDRPTSNLQVQRQSGCSRN